jgi:translation elongation factor EF-Ts
VLLKSLEHHGTQQRQVSFPCGSFVPADIVAKRIEGGVQKYLKEVSLHNQPFVKNDK